MISLFTIVSISFLHWVFDFHLQTDKMAKEKSTCNIALLDHVWVYTWGINIMMLVNSQYFSGWFNMVAFVLVNAVLHFVTDWITSRASSALWKDGKVHEFFVCIGFDQFCHHVTLFGTFIWLTSI